ncbi:MAG TPA: hypothetical protein VFM95_08660 [Microcella sp.]|nr:hypothetical protein [Microcella sp.]
MSSRTMVTAVPVWAAALVALGVVAVALPRDAHLAAVPLVAASAVLLAFGLQVATQRTDGVVRRLLVTIVGIVVIAAVASGLMLTVPGVD